MQSKGNFVPEPEDKKLFMDLAFLVDMTAHLNGLNMHIQGENHLSVLYFKS